ncbi:MAG: DNA/RNA nuclease SfsA [Aphanocapsa feldmannii 277cV]|uniref:Sugar fermentation stimulation protein homolog n=2 Tax=Aphanocapsa feldmannii TaxID=192050 RepID=A0A524RPJ7_9CHRO|nr:MAG: DNA/RNA nuclease SfsA [Aphanocapsa feldmannii 277cV]TGH27602.1 MAG: DNA/RNA nuclease SfsA [Aphanocapsa feldmannii 277cI]
MSPDQETTVLGFEPLVEGVLRRRYKRFLADVELAGGTLVTAHCPNTGPMTGVCQLGAVVRLRHAPSPSRKLAWTWEQIQVPSARGGHCWVGINTALPNRLLQTAITQGRLAEPLGSYDRLRREVAYGKGNRSRIDLLLERGDGPSTYIEIKNTTWTEGSVALFPDTVTERGQKHLEELIEVVRGGARGVLIFCVSRADCDRFAPGDTADPRYGQLFRAARAAGVEMLATCFDYRIDGVDWCGPVAVLERQPRP